MVPQQVVCWQLQLHQTEEFTKFVSGTEFHLLLSKKLGYRWPVTWSWKIPAKEKWKQRVGAWKIK
jgi:hypothetical protein